MPAGLNLIDISRPRQPRPQQKADNFTPANAAHGGGDRLIRTAVDYAGIVRRGIDANVIMAPIQWIMRTFPEAPAIVEKKAKGQWELVVDHQLEEQLAMPNPAYDGGILAQASIISFCLDGNAYWRKVRGRFDQVVEYWYVPHWMMEPKWPTDGSEFISHYDYTTVRGDKKPLDPRDVVHLRFGLDPRNPRKGLSPLRTLMREIFSDEEAANFAASMLRNMGVPGVVISPDGDVPIGEDDAKATKEYVKQNFTGDARGEPLVMGAKTKVEQFGFNPEQMALGSVRDVAEERVCAALGLPAAVVGFGAGLQSTKVGATMSQLVRLAWVCCLIPMQSTWGRQLSWQLLPDYVTKPSRFRVRFDASRVPAFADEEDLKVKRVAQKVMSGLQRIDQGQEELGMAPDPTQRIYLRPVNMQAYNEQGVPVGNPAKPDPGATQPPAPEPTADKPAATDAVDDDTPAKES